MRNLNPIALLLSLATWLAQRFVLLYIGVPSASGHPTYSGTFIPEIWSGKLVEKFYDATVFGEIANTDYEGEIKAYGDKVTIRTIPTIVIRDYVAGQNLIHQRPDSAPVELKIDRGKYFDFVCDDVMRKQMDLNFMEGWSTDASEQMKIEIDGLVLNAIYADADAQNKGATAGAKSASFNLGVSGTPIGLTKTNILDYLVDLGTVLDEQNRPNTDRWLVLPAWACGLIKKSDLKDASLTGDGQSVLRNGRIGMIDRWTIYMSNNYTSVTDGAFTAYHVVFGHKSALTFAAQMVNMETLRAESTFGDIVRGLNVFGFEVVHPKSMGDFYVYKG